MAKKDYFLFLKIHKNPKKNKLITFIFWFSFCFFIEILSIFIYSKINGWNYYKLLFCEKYSSFLWIYFFLTSIIFALIWTFWSSKEKGGKWLVPPPKHRPK